MKFGFDYSLLRQSRIDKSISVIKLSEKVGLSTNVIHNYERSKGVLTVKKLLKLCEILDVDVRELFYVVKGV